MIDLLLSRTISGEDGTFGTLAWHNTPFAVSAEDEWNNNASFVSCIPAGTYLCKRVNSPKFGDTFEVVDVQGRTLILFHWGNTEDDTEGCILVGEEFGTLDGKVAVLSSRRAFREFLTITKGRENFTLAVRDYWS